MNWTKNVVKPHNGLLADTFCLCWWSSTGAALWDGINGWKSDQTSVVIRGGGDDARVHSFRWPGGWPRVKLADPPGWSMLDAVSTSSVLSRDKVPVTLHRRRRYGVPASQTLPHRSAVAEPRFRVFLLAGNQPRGHQSPPWGQRSAEMTSSWPLDSLDRAHIWPPSPAVLKLEHRYFETPRHRPESYPPGKFRRTFWRKRRASRCPGVFYRVLYIAARLMGHA